MTTGIVLVDGLLAGPPWIPVWVLWLVAVNTASLGFLEHRVGQTVAASFAIVAPWMVGQAQFHGFTRLLGLPHLVIWTPLLLFLIRERAMLAPGSRVRQWVTALMLTIGLSLVLDTLDVARWVMGER